MSETGKWTLSDTTAFYAMSQGQIGSWHEAIENLAQEAWDAVTGDAFVTVSQGLEDARRAGKIEESLERACLFLFWKALRVAGVYGYALARTQPSGLEGFETWPQRALEFSGLATQTTQTDNAGAARPTEQPETYVQ